MRHIISWGVKRAKGRLKGMPREKLGVFSKKRAFTLVELLIAVMIIGILAGMMLMSAGSATDSAKAARIISDLRNMKAAALMYWADNRSWPRWFYAGEPTTILMVKLYPQSTVISQSKETAIFW